MKFAAALLIGSVAAKQDLSPTAQEALSITEGFIKGALDAEGFDDIEKCIGDGIALVKDAETAYTDLKKKDVKDIIAGLKAIGDGVKEVQAGLKDCAHLKDDYAKLTKMIAIFTSPEAFAWHTGKDLLLNGVDIYHEIDTSITDYEKKDWFGFGQNIGEAAAKTFIGVPEFEKQNKKIKAASILAGIIEAFGGSFDITALLMCIEEEDQALLMVDAAVQSFESAYAKKDLQDVLGGVIAMVAAVQQFK